MVKKRLTIKPKFRQEQMFSMLNYYIYKDYNRILLGDKSDLDEVKVIEKEYKEKLKEIEKKYDKKRVKLMKKLFLRASTEFKKAIAELSKVFEDMKEPIQEGRVKIDTDFDKREIYIDLEGTEEEINNWLKLSKAKAVLLKSYSPFIKIYIE